MFFPKHPLVEGGYALGLGVFWSFRWSRWWGRVTIQALFLLFSIYFTRFLDFWTFLSMPYFLFVILSFCVPFTRAFLENLYQYSIKASYLSSIFCSSLLENQRRWASSSCRSTFPSSLFYIQKMSSVFSLSPPLSPSLMNLGFPGFLPDLEEENPFLPWWIDLRPDFLWGRGAKKMETAFFSPWYVTPSKWREKS